VLRLSIETKKTAMLRRRWRPGEVVQLVIVWLTLTVGLGGGTSAMVAGEPSRPRHREISVSRGSMTFIRPSDLDLDRHTKMVAADLTSVCQIVVVIDDPGTLRVGRIQPEVRFESQATVSIYLVARAATGLPDSLLAVLQQFSFRDIVSHREVRAINVFPLTGLSSDNIIHSLLQKYKFSNAWKRPFSDSCFVRV
jgi:hypothetical protein